MFSALMKAISQSGEPAFRSVLLRGLLGTVATFVVVWIVAWFALDWGGTAIFDWLTAAEVGETWRELLGWLLGALGVAGVLLASFLLFPAVVGLVLGFFLDDITESVERRHYPALPPARPQPLGEMFGGALVFAAITIGLNILALPLYLVLLFLPPFNLFVFYGLNGYLLGREYFELVAARRLDAATARRLRRRHRGRVLTAGVVIAVLLTIPLVNLVTPIVATAFMVHVFHDVRRRSGA